MSFKKLLTSAVGRKITMGATGLFLVLFLIVHAGLNVCVFANDGGEMFNKAAHFMGGNWVPRILEIGLFFFLIVHIIQGLILEMSNRSKRGIGYNRNFGNRGSKWYSRSMGILGTLILIFLILHISNFWLPNRAHQGFLLGEEINLYERMKVTFSVGWIVVVYMLGLIALSYHLMHGFQSAFRSLGVYNIKYNKMLTCIGQAFAIIVPLIFALMPLSFYFGWLS